MFNNRINYRLPRNILFIFELLALMLMFLYYRETLNKITLIYSLALILLVYLSNFFLIKITSGDNFIFLIVTMLVSIGVIMIYRINPELGLKQILWIGMGIVLFFITYILFKQIKGWENWPWFYVAGSIILFILTLLLGRNVKGATNWIKIGPLSIQPSEIIKILTIFIIASYYTNREKFKGMKFGNYYLMGIIYLFVLFLFLQKDLGSVLIFLSVFIALQFVYEEDRKLVLINLSILVVCAVAGYYIFPHVRSRVQTWLDPWKYIDTRGYQITQSLFAIAEGGFFGTGLGLGYPEFIPEVHTDFIFPAICEEMGIFTGIGIIMLFLILVYRGFKIAINQRYRFYRIVALGISILFGIQSFIIFGGVLNMIPLTGITIPFVSYGGSSMLSSFIALGILQVASEELDFDEE